MKTTVHHGEIKIEGSGWEYSKLKTAIYNRIGAVLQIEGAYISFPSSCLPQLQDILPPDLGLSDEAKDIDDKFSKHTVARTRALDILERDAVENVSDFWRQQLDPAQAIAVSAMTVPDLLGLCLFDEQGSGKTVMTIAAFDVLKSSGTVDAMIVMCPKSMLSEWPKDIERFLTGKYTVVVADGNKQDKYQAALKKFDVLVTNYEGVDHMRVALSATASQRNYLLAVDESYYLKNADSLRSDSAARLRANCKRCYMLCGTPAPNSAYDLVNQFNLADSGYTFGAFKKSNDAEGDREKIEANIEARGVFIRRLKTDILENVPEKNFHVIRTRMNGRQAIMYEKARTDLELELRRLDNSTFKKSLVTYFQKRAALLQICSTPSAIDPTMTEVSSKMERLDALLSDLIGQNRKVILWSFYKRSLDELASRYAMYRPVRIDGSIGAESRKEAVKSFQDDPSTMLFIGNPAAAGAGITLHASYDAVYVSYSNQAAHYLQSLDRIHRRGQKANAVNYYLLVCEGTIEETEVLKLRGKELQQHSLLGDHIPWPTSLDEALKELSHIGV